MRASDITAQKVAEYCHLCAGDTEYEALDAVVKSDIEMALAAAKGYVGSYTGLDIAATELPDIAAAVLVVSAEMYDNRQLTTQYTGQNPMVMQILDLHSTNLVPQDETEVAADADVLS